MNTIIKWKLTEVHVCVWRVAMNRFYVRSHMYSDCSHINNKNEDIKCGHHSTRFHWQTRSMISGHRNIDERDFYFRNLHIHSCILFCTFIDRPHIHYFDLLQCHCWNCGACMHLSTCAKPMCQSIRWSFQCIVTIRANQPMYIVHMHEYTGMEACTLYARWWSKKAIKRNKKKHWPPRRQCEREEVIMIGSRKTNSV